MKTINFSKNEIQLSFSRSSGKGGQNVNKVNTKVTLRWFIDLNTSISDEVKARFIKKFKNQINEENELTIFSQETRNQKRNIEIAYEKLNQMINSVWEAPKKRKKTKPSKNAVEKRLKGKKIKSLLKKDRSKRYD